MSSIHTDLSLKEVLYSGSGKLGKRRLVSTYPGSGSDSGRRKHTQPACHPGRDQAQLLGSLARLLGAVRAFRSLGAEPLGERGAAGGRAAAVGPPRAQRREGIRKKAWFPQRLRLGLSFEVSHKLTGRPPGPGCSGTSG